MKPLTDNSDEAVAKSKHKDDASKDGEEDGIANEPRKDEREESESKPRRRKSVAGVSGQTGGGHDDPDGDAQKQGDGDDANNEEDWEDEESEDDEPETEPAFHTRLALDHFRCLTKFIDKYLDSSVKTYERVKDALRGGGKEGSVTKISFPDLWMLYDPDSIIYSPSKRGGSQKITNKVNDRVFETQDRRTPQAYRVLCSSGGMLTTAAFTIGMGYKADFWYDIPPQILRLGVGGKLRQKGENWLPSRVKGKYSDLVVYCCYIDYDTKKWAAVPDAFIFKPFEGEVEISSLEAYPLAPGSQLWNNMKERGKRFINMTLVSYCEYEGLTVGESQDREEVSQPLKPSK